MGTDEGKFISSVVCALIIIFDIPLYCPYDEGMKQHTGQHRTKKNSSNKPILILCDIRPIFGRIDAFVW